MVVSLAEGSYHTIIGGSLLFRWAATTRSKFSELIGQECSGEAYNITKIKIYKLS